MKHLKTLPFTAVAAMVLMAFAAGSASATTLEVNGVTQNSSVTISATIASGSFILTPTPANIYNICTSSTVSGASASPFTGATVTGAISTLSWTNCSDGDPTVHKKGQLYIEHESGTTGGIVYSENAEVTFPTSLGFTVNCKTGAGTRLGTLKGVAAGTQTMEMNAVLNCGFLLPSGLWKGTYTVTTSGLGVSA